MKRNLILRNASVVLTLLTVVTLASCRDQNFDWDEARATEQYQKFTNVFVKEFGKPAEGHQWGFDLAHVHEEDWFTAVDLGGGSAGAGTAEEIPGGAWLEILFPEHRTKSVFRQGYMRELWKGVCAQGLDKYKGRAEGLAVQ